MKKFSSLLVVLLLVLASFTAGVEYQRGDVDQDGQVGIADVTCLIDYLLNGTWSDEPVSPENHEYVDLGLPSGTLWATRNVGASTPEDYGDYFAWGETEPKDYFGWSTYKWCNGDGFSLTKYCTDSEYGIVDNKIELDCEDDAAYVNWGPSWRIPSQEQMQELCQNCTFQWTTLNGVNGDLITGPNGNTLFLPAAGFRRDGLFRGTGSGGYYWSCTLHSRRPNEANYLDFDSSIWVYWTGTDNGRLSGCPVRAVRAVRVPQN